MLALVAGEAGSTEVTMMDGQALLGFQPGSSQKDIVRFYSENGFSELADITSSSESDASVLKLVAVPTGMTGDGILALEEDPRVAYAEPDFLVDIDALPNDPLFDQLWGMHNAGQTGGLIDSDIDAPEAWDIATGSTQVVVGVIDTGVDYTHPDLYLNMWLNQAEIPATLREVLSDINDDGLITFVDLNNPANETHVTDLNDTGYIDAGDLLVDQRWADGADTDFNGFPDDLVGWDFVNNDNAPWDDYGHGTHVAGTIGATADDGTGVAGLNWSVQIMPLKFLSAAGSGTTSAAVQSVLYSTEMGANLTNNSWGGGGFSTALYEAIDASGAANMLFVAAAGNDAIDTDIMPHYPSSYDLGNIISVAATNDSDGRASFSSYGATTVDLGAPGVSILSTIPNGVYGSNSGTSMATPHVAGVAALAWSVDPNATFGEIRDAIYVSADPVDSMSGITVTGGRLNAAVTLQNINPHRGHLDLDKAAYTIPDSIGITVYDADLNVNPSLADTVEVEISSTSETTAEVIVLTETGVSTNAFTSSVALNAGEALPDGILQAVHGDIVTVVYKDAYDGSGPATVTATAIVDDQDPVISQISSTPASTRAIVSWETDELSDSAVRYGVDPNNLNLTLTDDLLTTSHTVAVTSLSPLTIYYFQVISADAAGNVTESESDSFTTLDVAPILFVDDDEGGNLETYFANALDANEYPFDIWDVYSVGFSPSAVDLTDYDVVIWNTGAEYEFATSGLTLSEEASISGYLDGGGNLFLSGQDVLWNGVSPGFRADYLHLAAYMDDDEVNRATGVAADPIGDGMDLPLTVPSAYEANYSDTLLPDSTAAGIFLASEVGYGGTYPYAATRYPANDAGPFKMVFFAFPFEAISTTAADPNNQTAVMASVIGWLGINAPDKPGIAVSPNSGLETTESGGTANFSVVLNTQPAFDVVISASTSDETEGLISLGSAPGATVDLTFTPDNWHTPQAVTITGVDDATEDGDIAYTIITAPAASSDPDYQGLNPFDVKVTNLDDDRRYPPVLDLDADNSSGAPGGNYVTVFDAGGGPVAISDVDAVLTDVDSADLTSLSIVITNLQDGIEESLTADTSGTSISASYELATGTLALSGTDTVGNYQQVLRTVMYGNTLVVPGTIARAITFVANDGEQESNTATTTVSIEGVNHPPVADAGGDYEILVGSPLYLNGSGSDDPDDGPSPLTYNWDLDDDGIFDNATGVYPVVSWGILESLGYEMGETYTISLEVSDGLAYDVGTAEVTVLANQSPTADAGGPYSINHGQMLMLNGSQSSDPDNLPSPLTYHWDLDNKGDFNDATGPYGLATWTTLAGLGYEMGGTYTIALQVSDGLASDVAYTTVTVAGNQVPTADAGGPYSINHGQMLMLNGSQSSDPDNLPSPLTYHWDLDNNGNFSDATGPYGFATWTTLAGLGYETGGTYTIALQVSDGMASDVKYATVTVAGNQDPTADPGGPYSISHGQTLMLNGWQSSDPDNLPSPLTFHWDLDNRGDFNDATGMFGFATWTTLAGLDYQMGGTYTIALQVSDGMANDVEYATVTVAGNQDPTAVAGGPYTISLGETLMLNGSLSSDPDNLPSPLTYNWDLDDDGDFNDATGQYGLATWTTLAGLGYQMGGTYPIALQVSDGMANDVEYATVTVAGNQPPVADAGGPYEVAEGVTLMLNGSGSYDPDSLPSPLTYNWDLDDDGDFDDADGRYPVVSWATLESLGYQAGVTYDIALEVNDGAVSHVDATQLTVLGNLAPNLRYGTVTDVGSAGWTTVTLDHTYESMVVIATPNYDRTSAPGVTRIRNAMGNSFDLRVDDAGGGAINGVDVHYVVVEEGVYNELGFKLEAVKFETSHIDRSGAWTGEFRSYSQSYSTPVVVGQVMSYNDPGFSAFWARGSSRTAPPSSTTLYVGRHVGQDPGWASRPTVDETIGYLVIQATAGVGDFEGLPFVAAVGGDTIRGVTNAPPYSYSYPTMPNSKAAVASQAGMDGGDGGWAVLYGDDPLPPSGATLRLAIDEDQLKDTERNHTTEQVAYLIIDPPLAREASVTLIAEPYSRLPVRLVDQGSLSMRPLEVRSKPLAREAGQATSPQVEVGEASVKAADKVFARLGDRTLARKGALGTPRMSWWATFDSDPFETFQLSDQFWYDLARDRRC